MKNKSILLVLVAIFIGLVSCSDNNDSQLTTGTLSVHLTDAPFPYDLVAEANVTVFKVDARGKFDKMKTAETDSLESESSSPFITLMENEIDVNLLDLTNGVTQQLAELEVPVGTYDLVRIYVKGVNVVLTDGTTYDLQVPSGSQSGIKLFVKPGIEVNGGLSSDLLLDFDVSRSFVAKGSTDKLENITGFNFKPVIKASNMTVAGTLMGLVTAQQDSTATAVGVEGAEVSVFAADSLSTTSFTNADGAYMIMGLDAGLYTVRANLDGHLEQVADSVEIVAGNKTVRDFEMVKE